MSNCLVAETPVQLLSDVIIDPMPEHLKDIEHSVDYNKLLESYDKFCDDRCTDYRLVSKAFKTNDLSLFIYSLGEMIPSFFASGQPNYSRWMMKYHLNLLNIDITHPGVKEFLEQGALSIRRRQKLSHCPLLTRHCNKLSRQALFRTV